MTTTFKFETIRLLETAGLLILSPLITKCHGHGLVEYPPARNHFCGVVTKPDQLWSDNAAYPNCFPIFDSGPRFGQEAYQFMSVLSNGPGRSRDDPLPSQVCGYGSDQFAGPLTPWDAYGPDIDWPVTQLTSGARQEFRWNIAWGRHFGDTMEFKHWVTRSDFVYDRTVPLTWDDLEDEPFCVLPYDDAANTANPDVTPLYDQAKFETYCTLPTRSGRHVIYAEWGRRPPSSDERFHGCIDALFGSGRPSPPTDQPVPLPTAQPVPFPTNLPTSRPTATPVSNPTPFPIQVPTIPHPTMAPIPLPTPPEATPTPGVACSISIQPGANPWFAGLQVGFDGGTIALDFSPTGLDLSQVTIQQGIWRNVEVQGSMVTLSAPSWVTSSTPAFLGINGNNVAGLGTMTLPRCNGSSIPTNPPPTMLPTPSTTVAPVPRPPTNVSPPPAMPVPSATATPPTPSSPIPSLPTSSEIFSATTTRYWDCSGGACGCAYVPDGLPNPGGEVHCSSNAMFQAPANNPFGALYYGTAAVSGALGGGNWMAPACDKCWKVTGTGLNGQTSSVVLRGANYCPPGNAACADGKAHFDIAAPDFDVLAFSLSNTCQKRAPIEDRPGFSACEGWMIDSADPPANCDCSLFEEPVLRAGCENFLSLQWNNPVVEYEEVACPAELFGDQCGYPYPFERDIPASCVGNSIEL